MKNKTQEEIEKLAEIKYVNLYGSDYADRIYGFTQGYIQCQQDVLEENYNEDDIKEIALYFIINTGGLPKSIEQWKDALWQFYKHTRNKHN